MEIWNQISFFLAGLGVFNGLLLAFYFFFMVKPRRWPNIVFGFLMLMLCLRIGKSLFHVFTHVDRIYRQIGLSGCLLIGPLLLLYIHLLLSKSKRPNSWVRLSVPVLLLAIIVVGIIWPYETNPALWNNVVVQAIYMVWIFYMIASFVLLLPLLKKALKTSLSIVEYWVLLVYSSVLALCIAYNLALCGFPYLAGPFLFSLVLYVLMAFLANKKNRNAILEEAPIKYQNQKVTEAKADVLLQGLLHFMQKEKPYLNQKIKLADIAKAVDSTPHEVSQVINDKLGITFNQYINEFRVKAACGLLQENGHWTVEGIGQEVGFSSRSTFYTAFKSVMDQTPGQYKDGMK